MMHAFHFALHRCVYHPTQELTNLYIMAEPAARILAGQSSAGKLGGREVKTSAP